MLCFHDILSFHGILRFPSPRAQNSAPAAAEMLPDSDQPVFFRLYAGLVMPVLKGLQAGGIQIPSQCFHFQFSRPFSIKRYPQHIDTGIQPDFSFEYFPVLHFQAQPGSGFQHIRFRKEGGNLTGQAQFHGKGGQSRSSDIISENISPFHITGISRDKFLLVGQYLLKIRLRHIRKGFPKFP